MAESRLIVDFPPVDSTSRFPNRQDEPPPVVHGARPALTDRTVTHVVSPPSSSRALAFSARIWFVAATLGQWAFVVFILAYFGLRTLSGDFAALNEKSHITGYVPGDMLGNLQLLLHVFLGAAVTFAGTLQLFPIIRRRWPAVHRWNGRAFLLAALIATLTGFYLTWVRGSQLNLPSALSTSLNGVLILVFATLAWRSARARDFARHRAHALRAYLLVNGVWFLRIGIVPVSAVLGSLGYSVTYDGVVFLVVSYMSWLAPLALLQLYLIAERASGKRFQQAVAMLLIVLALLTAAGSAAAVMFMWLPAL
jgi:Predicted membrane protein (DUF2306)